MDANTTYNLLHAVVKFRAAYNDLAKEYKSAYDADLSEEYPLGGFDIFDPDVVAATTAWLNHHATKLINSLPDRVINPSCIECLVLERKKLKSDMIAPDIKPNGCCCCKESDCCMYPFITFDSTQIRHYLATQNVCATVQLKPNVTYDDTAIRVLYKQLLNELHIKDMYIK